MVDIHNKASVYISENSPIPVPTVEIPKPDAPVSNAGKFLERFLHRKNQRARFEGIEDDFDGLFDDEEATDGIISKAYDWIDEHRILCASVALGISATLGYLLYKKYQKAQAQAALVKRKAKRAVNGARMEVVILAASPSEPLTRLIAADLERRGFIVYVTTTTPEEEKIIEKEDSQDIKPLSIPAEKPERIYRQLTKFAELLDSPVVAFPGATPHNLFLKGVIIIPDLYYPTAPVEALSIRSWSDAIYSKLLTPLALLSNGLIELVRVHHSRFIIINPTVMGQLSPPFHSVESIISTSITNLTQCLRRELSSQEIPVCHIKLGSLTTTKYKTKQSRTRLDSNTKADILSWPEEVRPVYAKSYASAVKLSNPVSTKIQTSLLKAIHHTVFDCLSLKKPKNIIRIGAGSGFYEMAGKFAPESTIDSMLFPKSKSSKISTEYSW